MENIPLLGVTLILRMKRKAALAAIRRLNNLPEEEYDDDDFKQDEIQPSSGEDLNQVIGTNSSDSSDFPPLRERMQTFTCDDESPVNRSDIFQAKIGTNWLSYSCENSTSGRLGHQNIMRVAPGPTCHATSRVIADSPLTAWRLLINETMLRHIRRCTNEEACRQSDRAEHWDVSVSELETTFGLFYAKGLFFSPKTPLRLL